MRRRFVMAVAAAMGMSSAAFVGTLVVHPEIYLSCGPLGWDFWCWLMSDVVGATRAIFG